MKSGFSKNPEMDGRVFFLLAELSRIRKVPEEELTEEILSLRQATKSEEGSGGEWTAGRVLKSKELLLPLVLVCSLQAGQQCVGINAVSTKENPTKNQCCQHRQTLKRG